MADEVTYKVAEDFKTTVKLFSGKEVTIDLMKLTSKEWRSVIAGLDFEEEIKILSKVTGLTEDELTSISQPDYRLIAEHFIKSGTQPLANPT